MNNTKLCENCQKTFPDNLFVPSIINAEGYIMCPICTRTAINAVHGLPEDTPFTGKGAQKLYSKAVKHLRDTGQVQS